MSLRPEEIDRIKFELGVPLSRIGAEPYITYVAVFDRVIQPYTYDNSTTSTTAVTTTGQATITLAANPVPPSNVGLTFAAGTSCIIDVGPSQETCVIQVLSGLTATLTFASTHPAGFIVYPNGSEQIVRDILTRLDTLKTQLMTVAPVSAGVGELVGEVRLTESRRGRTRSFDKFESLIQQREQARDDLGEALGFPNLRKIRRGGNTRVELY